MRKFPTCVFMVLLVLGLAFLSTRAQEKSITVENVDYYSTNMTESPPQNLTDVAARVTSRVVIEYSNWALGIGLYEPDPPPVITGPRRIVVEYADFILKSIMRMTADVSRDGSVNILDIYEVARAFGTKPGQSVWNPVADLDLNEWVNIIDVFMVAKEFRKIQIENFNIDS